MNSLKSRWLITFIWCVLMLGLMACSSKSQETKDGELADKLYFFNWGENIDPEILDDFKEEFGVEVVYDTFASNQEMLTKMKSGVVTYDLIVPTDYFIEEMRKEDLLAELNMDNIPNFKYIAEELRDPSFDPGNKVSIPYLYGSTGLAYNKAKVGEITSWEELWNPEYKGRVSVHTSAQAIYAMVLQYLGLETTRPTDEELERATEIVRALNENLHSYDNEPAAKLINEEVWVAMAYSDQAGQAMQQNPDIDYILPKEGGFLWMDNFAIPKDSPNQYTAEVFINYMLRPEVSKKLTDYIPSSNPNQGAIDLMTEEEKNNRASYPEIPDNALYYEYSPEHIDKMTRLLNEIKID